MRYLLLAAAAMPRVPWLLLLTPALVLISSHLPVIILPSAAGLPGPACRDNCGGVAIPYPFGIGSECSWQGRGEFTVTCNSTNRRPYISNLEIGNISLHAGQLRVFTPTTSAYVASECYISNSTIGSSPAATWNVSEPFQVSPKENEFTAVGCTTLALISGQNNPESSFFTTGCISSCLGTADDVAKDGEACSGSGCCQTSLPSNLSSINIMFWGNVTNNSTDMAIVNSWWETSPCSYGFVAEKGTYNFRRADINDATGNRNFINRLGANKQGILPVVLDWSIINNGSCQTGQNAPACVSDHSECVQRGLGYLCNCSHGYDGNPYLPDGCKDIDECSNTKNGPCGLFSKCSNTVGSYNCTCNFNRKGNPGSKEGCQDYKLSPYVIAVVAIILAIALLCVGAVHFKRRKRKKLFYKNGGQLLKSLNIIMYSKRDLNKITKKYSKCIGGGFFGNVYMGTTTEGDRTQQVAVKCTVSKKVAQSRQRTLRPEAPQQEQEESWKDGFVKEITFQCQINKHPNVVRLIGCCLETDVPILVFEFIRNGNLNEALHGGVVDKPCALTLLQRLDIGIGSAEGLLHMHTHQHIHGDIKPANILLDENLNPKVSDFGSSKLLSANRYARDVAADGQYADPVYQDTGCYTQKSDVYSFGVVLLELITRKKSTYDAGGSKILVIEFKRAFKCNGNGQTMYDAEILSDGHAHSHRYIECLDMVGALAVRCLNRDDPDDRPKMAEVVDQLGQAKKLIICGGPSFEAS